MYWKYEDNWECVRIYENVLNDLGNVLDYIRMYESDFEGTKRIGNVLECTKSYKKDLESTRIIENILKCT